MKTTCSIAFSPCPNDTYIFSHWVEKQEMFTCTIEPHLADIQQLNIWAKEKKFPFIKISAFCLAQLLEQYILLPVGAAIGTKNGPKVIAKKAYSSFDTLKIVVPGQDTTAYALMRLLYPKASQYIFRPYDQIISTIQDEEADIGVIIHETRFSFEKYDLIEIADLGLEFFKRFHILLPLGVYVAKKDTPKKLIYEVCRCMYRSLLLARMHTPLTPFIQGNSIEKDPTIIQKHIDLFVTEDTFFLSDNARTGITHFIKSLQDIGLTPAHPLQFFECTKNELTL